MKKIRINGKKLAAKYLYKICCRQGRAVIMKHKEIMAFDYGLILIKDRSGRIYQITTEEKPDIRCDFLFYDSADEENQFFCTDEMMEDSWQQICIYLFDDEGAFYLFIDRDCISSFGVAFENVDAKMKYDCRAKGVNAMEMMKKGTYQKILNMELGRHIEEEQLSLLEDKQLC